MNDGLTRLWLWARCNSLKKAAVCGLRTLVKPVVTGLDQRRWRDSGAIPRRCQEQLRPFLLFHRVHRRGKSDFSVSNSAISNRSRLAATVAAGALVLVSMPTAGLALGALDGGVNIPATGSFAALTPASVDPRLAEFVAERSNGSARLMRFTPAGVAERASRSVTVAIRIDEEAARVISVRSAIAAAQEQVAGDARVRVAPTRYNLGVSRGYQSFAKAPELSRTLSEAGIPNLADFRPSPGARPDESRFAAHVAVEEEAKTGASPRSIDSRSDQAVDVAGSYRLTRNLDVTAGVRYSQERDRLAPLAESTQQDSQAVYVGTQFRF